MCKIRRIQFERNAIDSGKKKILFKSNSLRGTFLKKIMSSDNLCNDKQHSKAPLLNLNKIKKNTREVQWPDMVSALNYR